MAGKGYQIGALLYENVKAGVKVSLGTYGSTGRQVVVKEQTYPNLDNANYSLAEAMNQARLDHPNIVRVYETRITQGVGFTCSIVMEYLPRGDLFKEIKRRKETSEYWSEREVLMHMKDLADALAYAQSREVAHRDLKPQNIFIGDDGRFKIGDFGSSSNSSLKAMSTTVLGSPYYLSPELKSMYLQMMGGSTGSYNPYQSDVFSLAVTILFMETLEIDQGISVSQNPLLPVAVRVEQLTHPLVQACLRMMIRETPADRVTFADLKKHIEVVLRGATACSVCTLEVSEQWKQFCTEHQMAAICSQKCYALTGGTVCYVCSNIVTQPLQLPEDYYRYQFFQQYLPQLCSMECFTALYQRRGRLCVYCEVEQGVQTGVQLQCGHCFHSQDCFQAYRQQWSAAVPLACWLCSTPIQEAQAATGTMVLCEKCGQTALGRWFPCGHCYCYRCGEENNWTCLRCSIVQR